MRKWAYMGIPHTGGTYSVFKSLRHGLLSHGVELHWIGVGTADASALAEGPGNGDLQLGTVVAPGEPQEQRQGAALVEFFTSAGYEGVFINALCGRVSTNFVRYLTPGMRRILIVHTTTAGAYAAARAVRDHVHATVGVSPRIAKDLIALKGFDDASTISIPNAIEVERFDIARKKAASDGATVLFLGRVEDGAKGCLLLPKIFEQLNRRGARARYVVAGDGPDLVELKRQCSAFSNVRFLGRVPYEDVPAVLAEADIYIFPSRYEGFGLSLVEAMACGCVPVASAIRGVTDTIIDDGSSGWLFPIGDWRRAAECIVRLAVDPARLQEMSLAASRSARTMFSIERIAHQYTDVMGAVVRAPRPLKLSLDVTQWSYPRGLRDGWRTCLPEGVKQRLRLVRERLASQTA
jgi:glycosyltransferase involved in cell wall biosynthesis